MTETKYVCSPCISICKLDKHNVCVGCYRTIEEIRRWFGLDNDAKAKILEDIKTRNTIR